MASATSAERSTAELMAAPSSCTISLASSLISKPRRFSVVCRRWKDATPAPAAGQTRRAQRKKAEPAALPVLVPDVAENLRAVFEIQRALDRGVDAEVHLRLFGDEG